MSKKTNEAKRKRVLRKPRRSAHKRKKRPNPLYGQPAPVSPLGLMGDPIFMHHALGALFRYMEITIPNFPDATGLYLKPGEVDAEFAEPEDSLAGTDNPEPPDAQKPEQTED